MIFLGEIWYPSYKIQDTRYKIMSDDMKVLMIFTAVKAQAFFLLGQLKTLGSGVTAVARRRQIALQQDSGASYGGPMPLVWSRAGV